MIIGLPIALGVFFLICFAGPLSECVVATYHTFRHPKRKVVAIVDPSPFRRNESYVIGPFSPIRALLIGHIIASRNPYTKITFASANCQVWQGTKLVYDGETRQNHTSPVYS